MRRSRSTGATNAQSVARGLILSAIGPRVIGKRYVGMYAGGDWMPAQPHVILREATLDEWLEQHPGCLLSPLANHFYEVSVD